MAQSPPVGVSVDWHDNVTSTMDLASSVTVDPGQQHWIMARHQSAARGRRGRSWLATDAAFSGTVVLNPNCPPQDAALRSFVAACALFDALAGYVPAALLAQKWPNDVLLQGGKVAGILLEASSSGGRVTQLAIGIGINLGRAPRDVPDAAFAPVGLADVTPSFPSASEFLPVLAKHLQIWETVMATQGFGPVRDAWMGQAARMGQAIKVHAGSQTLDGTFQGIDATGNLLLLTPKGQRAIPAADVIF